MILLEEYGRTLGRLVVKGDLESMVLWICQESKSRLHAQIFKKIKESELVNLCEPVIQRLKERIYLVTDIEDYTVLLEIIQNNFESILNLVNGEKKAVVILNTSHPFDVEAFYWAIVKPKEKAEELVRELLFDLFIYYSPCNIIEYILELPEEVKEFIKSAEYRGDVAIIKSDALRPLLEMFTERCLKIFSLTV
jgi:hypothetical protein